MIVCQCAGVSDRDILRLAQEGASVAEIGRRTGAGQCCTCCHDELVTLVEQRQQSRGEETPPLTAALGSSATA